ncbi:MAG TPA: HNH endonuclease signature motif containing protein [Reyranella sp.]|jgi:putative restriction endonuclease|nr:HNH endonuclease signature motif containing protein [Reyranella sp.]
MTQFWWVNHKQTARQEIDGQYLWSPKTTSKGTRNQFYDNMRRANPGDLVLSYANQVVRYVGRVAEFAFTAPKPTEFGSTGAYWDNEGWLLPVFWTELEPPVRPKALIEVLGPLLPNKYSPIRPSTGDGNQGVYLAEVSKPVFDAVVAASAINYQLLERGGANSLTFRVVSEELDDRVQKSILADAGLDTTVKEAVIQARRGQGRFRANVEAIEKACRLTKITNPFLLIASHIKPWRSCETAAERLDGMNGLLLTPDADLLFDRGFITFQDDGEVRVSPRFDSVDLRRLGLGELAMPRLGFSEAPMAWRTEAFAPEQCNYLAYHRSEVYVGE